MNWAQFKAILWLRWCLSRNQFIRAGRFNAILSILINLLVWLAASALMIGSFVGGTYFGPKITATTLLLIWDLVLFGFLIFWFTGLLVEIQRSESIDLTKLLHLPVTLPQVFFFNYAASHTTPSMVLLPPSMLTFSLGLASSLGPKMLLLPGLVVSFLFMLSAWTYCLRGWLAALMVNKRRRRAIIVWFTLFFVGISQLPNVLASSRLFRTGFEENSKNTAASHRVSDTFIKGHLAFPPGWVGYGAMELVAGNPWPALGATGAGTLMGILGLMRAYRLTLKFYQGDDSDMHARTYPSALTAPMKTGKLLLERRVPVVPEEVAALTLATFRSLSRAPELKMALIMPIVLGSIWISMRAGRPQLAAVALWSSFAVTGAAALASFSIAPTMSNVFGLDRGGFRAFVLLPTKRDYILIAKNLAFLPFVLVVSVLLMSLLIGFGHLSWSLLFPGVLQAITGFLLFCLAANLLSILFPYRLSPNSLQAKRPKPLIVLMIFVSMGVIPLTMSPLLLPPALELLLGSMNWAPWLPVYALAALLLMLVVIALYRTVLPLQGRLLLRREKLILLEVTEELE